MTMGLSDLALMSESNGDISFFAAWPIIYHGDRQYSWHALCVVRQQRRSNRTAPWRSLLTEQSENDSDLCPSPVAYGVVNARHRQSHDAPRGLLVSRRGRFLGGFQIG